MPLSAPPASRAVLAALLIACSWLAFDPNPPPAADTGWDKLNHALAFCALALAARPSFPGASAARLALALLGYGVFIELVQARIPGRSGDPLDLLGDAAGVAVGLVLAHGWRRFPTR